ncbi:hypothetical protein LJC57_06775 [Parabacteroides sp. OttesenSCG-928-G07]|nr:hypothetical protein [Parabacteroides sp. OttesenSCG-928-G07]
MKQICIILCILFLSSCSKSVEKTEKNFLRNAIRQIDVDYSEYKWIIIIPGLGCHGCIQEAEYFMKENINNPHILFALTNASSLKILQHKIGIELNNYPNIYIDNNRNLTIPTKNSIYPCIIWLEDGLIQKHLFQSPETDAFDRVKRISLN